MKRDVFRVLAASVALLLSIAAVTIWAVAKFSHYEAPQGSNTQNLKPVGRNYVTRTTYQDSWQRVHMEGKVSFYLPPDARLDRDACNAGGILTRDYVGKNFSISIGYTRTDSCSDFEYLRTLGTTSELFTKIDNQNARLVLLRQDNSSSMTLCVPDVGDGKHQLTVSGSCSDCSGQGGSPEILDHVFASITFPSSERQQ